jgi:hypothetical protein
MGQEVEDARVWGGIHYCTAVAHGSGLGHNVADYGLENQLQPVSSVAGN